MPSIDENSLYANLYVETSPVQATASWTNHIATVRDIRLTRGGIEPFIGINNVEPGAGTITLVDNNATINPGYWIRIKYSSSIIWAGYIQDVNRTYSNVNGVMYEYKTLTVLDWAAYVSQMTVTNLPAERAQWERNIDINGQVPSSPITPTTGPLPPGTNVFSQLVGTYTVGEALDLSVNSSTVAWWRPELVAPAGSASIDAIIATGTSNTGDNISLTDGTHTGTPTNLTYYTDIEVATKTSQVVNSIIINNIAALDGETLNVEYAKSDASSIATYGTRLATCDTNAWVDVTSIQNLFPYPSFEEYLNRYEDTNFYYSAEQPSLDSAGAWSAWDGSWAYRAYCKATAVPTVALPLSEVVSVTPGTTYYGFAYAAASAGLNSRARFFIQWQDDAQAIISTSYGSYVNHTSLKTWYKTSNSATAPANAVYARVGLQFSRTTGANIGALSKYWTDGLYFGKTNEANWFSGDTADTSTTLYGWTGTPNASPSFKATNYIDALATQFLTDNSTAKYSPYRVRLNAQANLTAVVLFNLYRALYVWFKNNRWTSVVTGISHQITINDDGTTRWMIDLDLRPSTATI